MDKLTIRVLKEYKKIAFADVKNVVKIENINDLTFSFSKNSSAISQISYISNKFGNTVKIKMYDKLKALKFLSKYLNILCNDDCFEKIVNLSSDQIQEMIDKIKKNIDE